MLKKILKDLTHIDDLIDEYWALVYKTDFGIPEPLTEFEKTYKKEILKNLELEILKFETDTEMLSKETCKSEKQKETENVNFVDSFRTLNLVWSRLQNFGSRDLELIESLELLKEAVVKFKDAIDDYRQRSTYQLYNWSEVAQKVKEEYEAVSRIFGIT